MTNLIFVPWSCKYDWQVMTEDREYVLFGSQGNIAVEVKWGSPDNRYGITGRNLRSRDPENRYNLLLVKILASLSPTCQVIEVGAGMGELIPHLATQGMLQNRPIAIDPTNYGLMLEMLRYAKQNITNERQRRRLDELERRCEIMKDHGKVRLVNHFLEEAMENNQDLRETADIVVDNWGAHHWAHLESSPAKAKVEELETQLLKPGGLLYYQWPAKPERKEGKKLVALK